MDQSVLEQFSGYVEWEESVRWVPVPADQQTLRSIGAPDTWVEALVGSMPVRDRIERLWKNLQLGLPRSYAAFRKHVHGLALLQTKQRGLSLIYVFQSGTDLFARRGFSPAPALPAVASRFPIDLSPIYFLHDGLVNLMSYDAGPLPCAEWRLVTVPDDDQPSFVKIVTDGSAAFGFDISTEPCKAFAISPEDDDVELVEDPWAYLDDLILGSLVEFGDVPNEQRGLPS